MSNQGIRVPRSIVIYKDTKILKSILNFEGPYFLKPVKLDNSIGIRSSYNIEKDKLKAIKKALRLSKVYDTPIMIEEYVDGFDETTPYAFLNGIPHIVALREIYDTKIQSNNLKDLRNKKIIKVEGTQSEELICVAQRIIRILDLNRYGRFDFRRDKKGNLYFLEFNPGTSLTCLSFEKFLKENNLSLSNFMKKMIMSNLD